MRKNEFITDDIDRINYAEECDYNNVISICKSTKSLAYGTGDEMRFFVEPYVYSEFFNTLRKMGFDCDGLIESKLAIDFSDIKEERK